MNGLIDKDDVWYLLAGTERGRRTFRVDRITEAEVTDQPADRPDDFALAAAWEEVVGEMERRRSRTWATVLIEPRFVPVLKTQFGRHCHPDGDADRGRARVRVAAPTALDIARHLAEPLPFGYPLGLGNDLLGQVPIRDVRQSGRVEFLPQAQPVVEHHAGAPERAGQRQALADIGIQPVVVT